MNRLRSAPCLAHCDHNHNMPCWPGFAANVQGESSVPEKWDTRTSACACGPVQAMPGLAPPLLCSGFTQAERSRLLMRRSNPGLSRTPGSRPLPRGAASVAAAAPAPPPPEYNWREQGKMSEVRDQTLGGTSICGSCWVFSALGKRFTLTPTGYLKNKRKQDLCPTSFAVRLDTH